MRLVSLFCEVVLLLFKTFIFMSMIAPKKENKFFRTMMYIAAIPLAITFFTCVYNNLLPNVMAVILCVSLPSFFIFIILSKHKGFRFYVTFCMVETMWFILAFYTRIPGLLGNELWSAVCAIIAVIATFIFYLTGSKYLEDYRDIMEKVNKGWAFTALSSTLIYGLLTLSAIYPKPLRYRPEYVLTYTFMTFVMLSFYVVFIIHIRRKRELLDLNAQLLGEKRWHEIAYIDALTGMNNRMAFVERMNKDERDFIDGSRVFAVMIDIDGFKSVNDELGHHVGDDTLKKAAQIIGGLFPEKEYDSFRIGGDEFALIATNVDESILRVRLDALKAVSLCDELPCRFSVGYSEIVIEENNAFENAFIRADKEMYECKNSKKINL